MEWRQEDITKSRRWHEELLAPVYEQTFEAALPSHEEIKAAEQATYKHLPEQGVAPDVVFENLRAISRGFNRPSLSRNYYGFVTGGVTPIASLADSFVSVYDQNVQVHLPEETIATRVEFQTLQMLCELLDFSRDTFKHRTFTTGATASNVLGLACGREYVISKAAGKSAVEASVGKDGLLAAMRKAGVDDIQILTTVPHSSLGKAASIVGLGRDSLRSVAQERLPHKFDLDRLRAELCKPRVASIVVVSCGEVNTGFFATDGDELRKIRTLCDSVGAYIHCDGAFGLMARLLGQSERSSSEKHAIEGCSGLELVDSITGDAHKLLNVPYDCGFFLSRDVTLAMNVFRNAGAAYLNATSSSDGGVTVPSPLNIGIENSRRFRALPVYASLVAYGRSGYADMLLHQIELAREVSKWISRHGLFQLLPKDYHEPRGFSHVYIVVLFRAKDAGLNAELVKRINRTRKIYVSGTSWDGEPAARIAVSNWKTDAARDVPLITSTLETVSQQWSLREV